MSFSNMKITNENKNEYGVTALPDTLAGSAEDNKQKFDSLPNFIADKHNEIVSFVEENIYTKSQVDTNINSKITEISSADMTKAKFATNAKSSSGYVDKAIYSDNGFSLYTQSNNYLSGSGDIGRFKATKSYTYQSFIISGVTYNVKKGDEDSADIIQGNWYTFVLDWSDKTINFTSGGDEISLNVIYTSKRPASLPKDNTIVVYVPNTEEDKPYYILSKWYPVKRKDGSALQHKDIFIWSTTTSGAKTFAYADKKKHIMLNIYKVFVRHADTNTWVNYPFEIYVDGQWFKSVYTLLPNSALTLVDKKSSNASILKSNGTLAYKTTWTNSEQWAQSRTNLIDLSYYNTMRITYSNTVENGESALASPAYAMVLVSNNSNANIIDGATWSVSTVGTDMVVDINISSYTGNQYIYFGTYGGWGNTNVTFKTVELM